MVADAAHGYSYGTFQDEMNLYFILEYIPGGDIYNIARLPSLNVEW